MYSKQKIPVHFQIDHPSSLPDKTEEPSLLSTEKPLSTASEKSFPFALLLLLHFFYKNQDW